MHTPYHSSEATLLIWNQTSFQAERCLYSKMSNNVPDKIKPFGTLRDFGAGHLGHYETLLYGHCLGPFGTLRDFSLGHYKTPPLKLPKIFFGRFAPPPPLLESWKNFSSGRVVPVPPGWPHHCEIP